MPTTANRKLPYPASTDPADVPADLQRLAVALDELAYVQFASNVNVPITVMTAIVSAGSVVYEAVPVLIQFYCAGINPAAAVNASTNVYLFVDGSVAGLMAGVYNPAAAVMQAPCYAERRVTPAAGAHTYEVRASSSGGTGVLAAGDGTGSNNPPGFLRVSRV